MALAKEIEIVVDVDPCGIGLCQNPFGLPRFAVGKIEAQLSLIASHCLKAHPAAVGKPLHSDNGVVGFIINLNPGWGTVVTDFGDAHASARIRHSGLWVMLCDDARSQRLEIDKGADRNIGFVGLQISESL